MRRNRALWFFLFLTGALLSVLMQHGMNLAVAPGRAASCRANIRSIGIACEMYSTDFAGRYPGSLSQLVPNYLKTLPTCPEAGFDTYSANFWSSAAPDHFVICCTGHFHRSAGLPPNYPVDESTICTLSDLRDPRGVVIESNLDLCCAQLRQAGAAVESYYRLRGHLPPPERSDFDDGPSLPLLSGAGCKDERGCSFLYQPGNRGHFVLRSSQRGDYLDRGLAPREPHYEGGRGLVATHLRVIPSLPSSDRWRTLIAVAALVSVLKVSVSRIRQQAEHRGTELLRYCGCGPFGAVSGDDERT